MNRIGNITESNGPDRFNSNPGCKDHQAGVKTGITDYCCCCDPCMYVRKNETASLPKDRHCCRCNPKLIIAKFTPDSSADCCRDIMIPMLIDIWKDTVGTETLRYTGSLVDYEIFIYLSDGPVDAGDGNSGSDYMGCRWTIRIPGLNIFEEIEIDHQTVTCLGVPDISITNVAALESCTGTISLFNFDLVKVPFQQREFPSGFDDGEGLSIPFPGGFYCDGCTEIPRVICVSNRRHDGRGIEWAEFIWLDDWIPYYDYDIEQDIIGVWKFFPEDPDAFVESLYLTQDYSGACWLRPDFESPAGVGLEGEYFGAIPLDSCGCSLKILDVRPLIDPSTPPDYLGIDLRAGRCSCWDYVCGTRRCVPRYLCGFVFIDEKFYNNITFSWDNATKSWISSGGVSSDGYELPQDISIFLQGDGKGGCELTTSYGDYIITPQSINSDETLLSGSIEGHLYDGNGYFNLSFSTSFDGSCKRILTCVTATPCAANCGSHPEKLNLTLHGWSTYSDYPPPPVTGSCTTEIELIYWQTIASGGDANILIGCGYVGYVLVDSTDYDDDLDAFVTRKYLIKAELSLGQLTITRRLASDPSNIVYTKAVVLDSETCDPYEGDYFEELSLHNCFFGDTSIIWHRWTAEIVE